MLNKEPLFSNDLPFYWYPQKTYNEGVLPKSLPFQLSYDNEIGLIKQNYDQEVAENLEKAYNIGSEVIGLMDSDGIGKKYADDFIGFIGSLVDLDTIKGKKILEIGCGTGYLLHEFQKLGAEVIGYEPGYAKIGKYPINCISNFFPTSEVEGKKFDVIIAYNLLEHIESLEGILTLIKNALIDDTGVAILSVPDCETYIRNGDISMFFHEHYSYFTENSLNNLLSKNGFFVSQSRKAGFGGNIYVGAKSSKIVQDINNDFSLYENLQNHFETKVNNFKNFIQDNKQKELGIYIPIRALNLLYVLKDNIQNLDIHLRFFDDSTYLHQNYLPCFDIVIEDFDSLVNNPPEIMVIFSYSFGYQIKEKILNRLPNGIKIFTIDEVI